MIALERSADNAENLRLMVATAKAVIEGEDDIISALANTSAVIMAYLPDINWAGFYIMKDDCLVLGPFQGLPACTRIKPGQGVCGSAAERAGTIVVDNVHTFPGHIACDSASNSEIVIPLFCGSNVFGVLDVDSPLFSRFGKQEADALEEVAQMLSELIFTL